jgi:hypothetical protein
MRRRQALALGLLAVVTAAAGLGVLAIDRASTDEPVAIDEQQVDADGERLEAVFVVGIEHRPASAAYATLTITNRSARPAWYLASSCSGPALPEITPTGDQPRASAWREDLAEHGRTVILGREDGSRDSCDLLPELRPVRLDAGVSKTFRYASEVSLVDRSTDVHGVVVVTESTEDGDPVVDLRLDVPFGRLPGTRHVPVEAAVDAFLAEPEVADFVAEFGGGSYPSAVREEDGWRFTVTGSQELLVGHVSADSLAVDVSVERPQGS